MSGRIVVTGGSGRVGRAVIAELAGAYDVLNVDRDPGAGQVAHEAVDVMDLDGLRRVTKGAQAIIHLAAIDYDWAAAPEEFMRVNTLGSYNVLRAAVENDVPQVVLCSSISACGLSEMRPEWPPQVLPVTELHECRPVQAYSVSKQVIETMALSIVRGSNTNVICLRPMAVVLEETLPDFVKFVEEPNRSWLFYYVTAQDVARGFRAAVETSDLRYGVFFLSAADSTLEQPTLDWYRERIGPLPEIANPRLYRDNPRASIFSSVKAREVLGWEPTSNFLELRKAALTGR